MSKATQDRIFNNDLNALKKSDMTIALITGWDVDSGTAGEIGFTFASGKPVIGLMCLNGDIDIYLQMA